VPAKRASFTGAFLERPDLQSLEICEAHLSAARIGDPSAVCAPAEIAPAVRDALEIYLGAHIGAPVPTTTERNKILARIATASERILASDPAGSASDWRGKLHQALKELEINGESALHRAITKADRDRPGGARGTTGVAHLRTLSLQSLPLSAEDVWLLETVIAATSNRAEWVQKRAAEDLLNPTRLQRERDSFLPLLIKTLAPLWTRATARTALSEIDAANADGGPVYPFVDWVDALLASATEHINKHAHPESRIHRAAAERNWELRPGAVREIIRRGKTENP